MKQRLVQIHNTMGLIETKGDSTMLMAECILAVRQLINEAEQVEKMKGEGIDDGCSSKDA